MHPNVWRVNQLKSNNLKVLLDLPDIIVANGSNALDKNNTETETFICHFTRAYLKSPSSKNGGKKLYKCIWTDNDTCKKVNYKAMPKKKDKIRIQNIPPEKQTKRRIMIWLKNIWNVSFVAFVFERVGKIQMGSFQAVWMQRLQSEGGDVIALWSRKRSQHV